MTRIKRTFNITIGIYDTNTGLCLSEATRTWATTGCSARAESQVIRLVKDYVLEGWSKPTWCKRYGLTATQFNTMLADGVIDPLESITFKVEKCEVIAFEEYRHTTPRGGSVEEVRAYMDAAYMNGL